MRKGFDSLSGIVISQLKMDVLNGAFFIFINKKHNQLKCFYGKAMALLSITNDLKRELMKCPLPVKIIPDFQSAMKRFNIFFKVSV